MPPRKQYKKRPDQAVVAVKLALDTDGFTYRKWGGEQRCKAGDWIVDNHGDVYSVDAVTFERTYSRVSPGRYLKLAPVWAEQAEAAGSIRTKEGETRYEAGDFVVFNEPDGGDGYAVRRDAFLRMYERVE